MTAHMQEEQEVPPNPESQAPAQPCSLDFQSIQKSGCDKEKEGCKTSSLSSR